MSSNSNDLSKVFQSSFSERVKSYWNVLPIKIKKSKSILDFKKNLESYKTENKTSINQNYYWSVSTTLLQKMENECYMNNKKIYFNYIRKNFRN